MHKQPIKAGDNHQLYSTILQSLGYIGVSKHQELQAYNQPKSPN